MPTIFFGISILGLIAASLLFRAWSLDRQNYLACWAGASGCMAVAAGALEYRSILPPIGGIGLIHAGVILAAGLVWAGARSLRGRSLPLLPVFVALVLDQAAMWLDVQGGWNDALRRTVLNGFVALSYALTWRDLRGAADGPRMPGLRALDWTVAVLALLAATLAIEPGLLQASTLPPGTVAVASLALLGIPALLSLVVERQAALQRASMAEEDARQDMERLLAQLPAVVTLREIAADGATRLRCRGGDFRSVLGWAPADIEAMGGARMLATAGTDPGSVNDADLRRTGRLKVEWQARRPDGSARWVRSHLEVVNRRPDGGYDVVRHTIDIDAERRAMESAVAAERLASLGLVAANIAHELKQPLAVLSLASEAIAKAAEAGDLAPVRQRAPRIRAQVRRMTEVIENVRQFARGAEAAAVAVPTDLGEVVRGAALLTKSLMKDSLVTLDIAQDVAWPVVLGGLVPLEQVLVNLLTNARDALSERPDDVPRRIIIEPGTGLPGEAVLIVRDNGGGIPAEILPRLFERFASSKPVGTGTGLGLAVSRDIVMAYGGSLSAANTDEGAEFRITLRRAEAEAPVGAGTPA